MLARGLAQRGHRVLTACPGGNWLSDAHRAASLECYEMEVRGWAAVRQLYALARQMRRERFSVVHSHTIRSAIQGYLISRVVGIPLVVTPHSSRHTPVYRWLIPRGNNRILAVSDFVRRELLLQGVPAARIRTVHNGTDLLETSEQSAAGAASQSSQKPSLPLDAGSAPNAGRADILRELNLPPGARVIGVVGPVTEAKGQQLLLEAAPQIAAARPDTAFLLVGELSAEDRERLVALACRLGVADRVVFTGYREDATHLMRAMDVVAVPSEAETFGLVVVEAMALGKPVVATAVGGIPKIVRDGETGLLVPREPPALAAAVIRILGSGEMLEAMGSAGLRRVSQRFTAAQMVAGTESLYLNALGRPA